MITLRKSWKMGVMISLLSKFPSIHFLWCHLFGQQLGVWLSFSQLKNNIIWRFRRVALNLRGSVLKILPGELFIKYHVAFRRLLPICAAHWILREASIHRAVQSTWGGSTPRGHVCIFLRMISYFRSLVHICFSQTSVFLHDFTSVSDFCGQMFHMVYDTWILAEWRAPGQALWLLLLHSRRHPSSWSMRQRMRTCWMEASYRRRYKGTREPPLHLGVCKDSKCFGCCSNVKPSFFSLFLKAICALMFSLVELGCL